MTDTPKEITPINKENTPKLTVYTNTSNLHLRDKLTELANAERFARQHKDMVRFVSGWGNWVMWDGRRWRNAGIQEIRKLAKKTVMSLYTEIPKVKNEQERNALLKHAKNSESLSRIKAMIELAKSQGNMCLSSSVFDADPFLLNLQNGTMNLRTWKIHEHKREDFLTKLCPVDFDIKAQCPVFTDFISSIMSGDKELISYLQRVFGYCMTGDMREHAFFIGVGDGANGKSTLLSAIQNVLGDYAQQASADLLTVKYSDASSDLAGLQGFRFVVLSELDRNKTFAESLVKQITGGDKIRARHLYKDLSEFQPQCKIFIATNQLPEIIGTDGGIWRRIRTIYFRAIIPKNRQDKQLSKKLNAEASGILNWMLVGCKFWQETGLDTPQEIEKGVEDYRQESDLLIKFLSENCVCGKGYKIQSSLLYQSYKQWSDLPITQKDFTTSMERQGFKKKKSSSVYWIGVDLKKLII